MLIIDKLRTRYEDWRMRRHATPIEIATIYKSYGRIGYPKKKGFKVEVLMGSGRVAIYSLTSKKRAWNVDWSWVEFKFSHYKKTNEQAYPRLNY